jgi:hypothetical protein
MTDCPKFVKMQKMFHGKYVIITEFQLVAKTQTIIEDVIRWMLMLPQEAK